MNLIKVDIDPQRNMI